MGLPRALQIEHNKDMREKSNFDFLIIGFIAGYRVISKQLLARSLRLKSVVS